MRSTCGTRTALPRCSSARAGRGAFRRTDAGWRRRSMRRADARSCLLPVKAGEPRSLPRNDLAHPPHVVAPGRQAHPRRRERARRRAPALRPGLERRGPARRSRRRGSRSDSSRSRRTGASSSARGPDRLFYALPDRGRRPGVHPRPRRGGPPASASRRTARRCTLTAAGSSPRAVIRLDLETGEKETVARADAGRSGGRRRGRLRRSSRRTSRRTPTATTASSPTCSSWRASDESEPLRSCLAAALLATSSLFAQVPPDADQAKDALAKSPRHGEWVDIALPGGGKVVTWVVYPEKKEKAGIVIVIHEIFGLSDWVRGVADQLAKEGFIALAPDLLSGNGPERRRHRLPRRGRDEGDPQPHARPTPPRALNAVRDVRAQAAGRERQGGFRRVLLGRSDELRLRGRPAEARRRRRLLRHVARDPATTTRRSARPSSGFYGGDDARVDATIPTRRGGDEEARQALRAERVRGRGTRVPAPADGTRRREREGHREGLAGDARVFPRALK